MREKGRQTENREKDGDRIIMKIKVEADKLKLTPPPLDIDLNGAMSLVLNYYQSQCTYEPQYSPNVFNGLLADFCIWPSCKGLAS